MSELSHDESHQLKEEQQQQQQQQWLLGHTQISSASEFASLTKLELANLGLTKLPLCLPEFCPSLSILFCPKNKFV